MFTVFFFYNYYLLKLRETRENTAETPFEKQKRKAFETVIFLFPRRDNDEKLSAQFTPLATYVMRSRCVPCKDGYFTGFGVHAFIVMNISSIRKSCYISQIGFIFLLVYRRIINLRQITTINV